MRIVSLVPSITDLLHYLGLNEEVIGITKFCIHPKTWYEEKQRIGGTKTVEVDTVINLHPDLVIANKEENVKDQVEAIANSGIEVYVTDINNLNDCLEMIETLGRLFNRDNQSTKLIQNLNQEYNKFKGISNLGEVLYLIWRKPFMSAGSDTFINFQLNQMGLSNAIKEKRYPELSLEKMKELNPKAVLLSSEPYPFREKHIQEIQDTLPEAKVILVDGELFSWYGSMIIGFPNYALKLRKLF